MPDKGEIAYQHITYAPLRAAEITKIGTLMDREIPNPLKDFYEFSNGLRLYNGSVSLYGMRRNYKRDLTSAVRQPLDIVAYNVRERSRFLESEELDVAFYSWDGSIAAMNTDGRVRRVEARAGGGVLGLWPSLDAWLTSEIDRIDGYHGKDGSRSVDGSLIFGKSL